MSSRSRATALAVASGLVAVACVKVPYTNRTPFVLIPNGEMMSLGKEAYREIRQQSRVVKDGPDVERLRAVGRRISARANQPDYAWQFSLFDSDEVNAWCLPGGYIGFYTGILPVLQNEAAMGFVMGHEVGHAVARHSAEQLSTQLGLQGALGLVGTFVGGSDKLDEDQKGLIMGALGLGATFGVILPFSRAHEKEADVIGLMYAAEAGYPPAESVRLWERMEARAGKGPPAFLSTHPSNPARIENLQAWMPQAKKKFVRARRAGDEPLRGVW
jgi:predicted Zn-dependent protease